MLKLKLHFKFCADKFLRILLTVENHVIDFKTILIKKNN